MSPSVNFHTFVASSGAKVCKGFSGASLDGGNELVPSAIVSPLVSSRVECFSLKSFVVVPTFPSKTFGSMTVEGNVLVKSVLQAREGVSWLGLDFAQFSANPPPLCPSSARAMDFQGSENSILGESIPLHHGARSQGSTNSKIGQSLSFKDLLVGSNQRKKFKLIVWDARPFKDNSASSGCQNSKTSPKTLIRKPSSSLVLVFSEKLKKEVNAGEQFFASNGFISQFNYLWPKLPDLHY